MNEELVLAQCKLEVDTRIAALRRAERCQLEAEIAGTLSYVDALVDIGMVSTSFRDETKNKAHEAAEERRNYITKLEFGLVSFFIQLAAVVGAGGSAIALFLGRSMPGDYLYMLVFGLFFLQGLLHVVLSYGYKTIVREALKYKIRIVMAGPLIGFVAYIITACLLEARYASV